MNKVECHHMYMGTCVLECTSVHTYTLTCRSVSAESVHYHINMRNSEGGGKWDIKSRSPEPTWPEVWQFREAICISELHMAYLHSWLISLNYNHGLLAQG